MKNYFVIINSTSGVGEGPEALEQLKQRAQEHGVELTVHWTEEEGDAERLARDESLEEFKAIISIGGDGTLNEVVNGLLAREDQRRVPVGILPTGTGNSLMKDLGAETVEQALPDLFSGTSFEMDAFEADLDGRKRYGLNMVGCGFPSSVNRFAEEARRFGLLRYNFGLARAFLRYKEVGYTLSLNDGEETVTTDFIIMTNTKHIADGINIAPGACLDDGVLDLSFLTEFRRRVLVSLFLKLQKGVHLEDEAVRCEQVTSFSITAPSRQEINIDGEQLSFQKLEVRVLPGSVTLLHVPPEDHRAA